MKKITFLIIALVVAANLVRANQTRMNILMDGDYIDDLVNIDVYPNQIITYQNSLYGDITAELADYGIILTPHKKYGALACWQNAEQAKEFNLGYAFNLLKFDIGISGSPVKDHFRYGFGIGRMYFNRRFDISVFVNDEIDDLWYDVNLRFTRRKGDFIVIAKYGLHYVTESFDYNEHRIGVMLQRLILNEGFVYFVGEYDFSRGDIKHDYTKFYMGLELPLGRKLTLLLGTNEIFTNGFESPKWQIEPGIGLRIREFNINFHINRERFFNKDVTLFNSVGLDLDFSRF